jgi:hypothetical protein
MIPPLDVFSVKNSEALCLGVAENLVAAFKMARDKGPGPYLVISHITGRKTMYAVDDSGEIRCADSAD